MDCMKLRPTKAWCITKGGKLLVNEIYANNKDVILSPGEKFVRVIISCEKTK